MHRRAGIIARVAIAVMAMVVGGCDREPPAPAVPSTAPVSVAPAAPRVESLTPLLPRRSTHVAVSASGEVYWVQRNQTRLGAGDIVFALGGDGIPRATQLTSSDVLGAMNAGSAATGEIAALCGGADDSIYFYFSGADGARALACLGRYLPDKQTIHILADTRALARASRMGASLALASGALIPSNDRKIAWLWLRHTDASMLFQLKTDGSGDDKAFNLSRPFEAVHAPDGQALALTDPRQQIGPGTDGSLLLLDMPAALLRQIDRASGEAKDLLPLVGLPEALSAPIGVEDGSKRVLLFASPASSITPRTSEQAQTPPVIPAQSVPYPALIVISGGRVEQVLPAEQFKARPGFPLYMMELQRLVSAGDGSFVAYDAGSGELLRIHLR